MRYACHPCKPAHGRQSLVHLYSNQNTCGGSSGGRFGLGRRGRPLRASSITVAVLVVLVNQPYTVVQQAKHVRRKHWRRQVGLGRKRPLQASSVTVTVLVAVVNQPAMHSLKKLHGVVNIRVAPQPRRTQPCPGAEERRPTARPRRCP